MAAKSKKDSLLIICIVYGKEFLDRVLETFLDIGIPGATVIQSQGMGRILSRKYPLFSGFKDLLETGGPLNYTVLAAVEDSELVHQLTERLPELRHGEFCKGVLFTVPISKFVKFDELGSQSVE